MERKMFEFQKRVQNLAELKKIDNKIITKIRKIAGFYEDFEGAFELIIQRICVDSGSICIRIDFATTKTFDLFLEQEKKSFKKSPSIISPTNFLFLF